MREESTMTAGASSNPVNFRKIVTSQWGEDGIIEEIFRRIGTEHDFCVEFGAWDGKHLSNTWDLWHNKGWSAILIEGDRERCEALEKSLQSFGKVKAHQAYVAPAGENSLDDILTRLDAPRRLDLLSIDIDSDDYYIFESLTKFSPRLVVVEYNPTVPPEIDLVQAHGEYFGASARAMVNLAKKKGYRLVCCTQTNCFFVLDSEFSKLDMPEPALEDVFPREHLTYVITSQAGLAYVSRTPTYASLKLATLRNLIESRLRTRFLRHPKLLVRGSEQMSPSEKVSPVRIFHA